MIRKGAAPVGLVLMSPRWLRCAGNGGRAAYSPARHRSMAPRCRHRKPDLRVLMGTVPHECVYRPAASAPSAFHFRYGQSPVARRRSCRVGIAFCRRYRGRSPCFSGQRRGYRYAGIGPALFHLISAAANHVLNTLPLHYTPILTSEMTFSILPPAIGQFQKI